MFQLYSLFNPLITNPTKWSNTLKLFVGKLPTNCLSGFDHFVGLALKELKKIVILLTEGNNVNPLMHNVH